MLSALESVTPGRAPEGLDGWKGERAAPPRLPQRAGFDMGGEGESGERGRGSRESGEKTHERVPFEIPTVSGSS